MSSTEQMQNPICVLIESDWNLKLETIDHIAEYLNVLIESDWNLKYV